MKKKIILAGIVLWGVIALAIIGVMAYYWSGGSFPMYSMSFRADFGSELLKEEDADASGIKKLALQGRSWTVRLVPSDSADSFHIAQYGGANTPESLRYMLTRNGDTLEVAIPERRNLAIGLSMASEELVISVPRGWLGDVDASATSGGVRLDGDFTWERVNLSATSGSIRVKTLSCGSLTLEASSGGISCDGEIKSSGGVSAKTSSGTIRLSDKVTGAAVSVSASSGGIRTEAEIDAGASFEAAASSGTIRIGAAVTAERVTLSTTSGGINAEEIRTSGYGISSSSGTVKIGGISGGGTLKTTSGGINAVLTAPVGSVDIAASSGTVRLGVPSSLSFRFEGQTSSGTIRTDFDVLYSDSRGKNGFATVGNSPTAEISVGTTSGGIHVNYSV